MATSNTVIAVGRDVTEYRPLTEDHVDEFREITSDAFAPERGPGVPDPDDSAEIGERRGVFEGETLVAVCRQYYLPTRVRGEWLNAGLLAAVATPPEYRRRGHARTLLDGTLREYRSRDIPISLLWPFDHGFYARYGWGRTNEYATVELPVGTLPSGSDRDRGRILRIDSDEGRRLESAYHAHADGYDLSLDRTSDWWTRQVLTSGGKDCYTYAYERDGELHGYVVYRIESTGDALDDRILRARELAWTDRAAYRRLLAFLHDHDAQVNRVELRLPLNAPMFDLVGDPAAVEYRVVPGPMARIVDVVKALTGTPVPGEGGRLTLRVEDPLAEWNDRTFTLDATRERIACKPTDASPAATVRIGTLSRLYVGSMSADDAIGCGDLDAEDDATAILDGVFPERSVFLREFF